MANDFLNLVIWWAVIFILGLLFYPGATLLFRDFFDKGYIFSKVIALALVSYVIWLLASFKIAPFSLLTIYTVLGLFIIGGIYSYFKVKPNFKSVLKYLIFEEVLFSIGLLFFAYIRGLQPDISGLEKFMDFGFLNTILRSKYLPPQDMWFSGATINYYYFGHFVTAFLIKITLIKSAVGYNLMIATLFSFSLVLSFSLSANIIFQAFKNIWKSFIGGLISALILVFASNYHTIIYAWILPWLKHIGIYHGEIVKYFYANSTRFIGYSPPTDDKTIHEFPSYSFVVSDLHAHVLNLPFVITFLALVFAVMIMTKNKARLSRSLYFFLALFLAIFYMTNLWDFGIYILVLFLALIFARKKTSLNANGILTAMVDLGKIVLTSLLMTLPFILHFKNTTLGLRFASHHTPIYQLLILWGFQIILALVFILFLWMKRKRSDKTSKNCEVSDLFILTLIIIFIVCLIIPEVILVKDIYATSYERANTMFKFTYQAYVMMAIASGYIIIRLSTGISRYKFLLVLFFILTVGPPLIFPFYSIKGYYNNLRVNNYKTLDGSSFLKKKMPDDAKAISYLNNLKGQPVTLEATGDSYSDYERISTFTGLPTVLGWYVHEWLWRGENSGISARSNDIATIYSSDDFTQTQELVKNYQIEYIVIGKLEYDSYEVNLDNLKKLGQTVLDLPEIKIIKVKK